MTPMIFFDRSEDDFYRFATVYPQAFFAWTADFAIETILKHRDATVIGLCFGYIKGESDLLEQWLTENDVALKPKLNIIVHARQTPQGEEIAQRLSAIGYSVERKMFGINWMQGVKPCQNC